MDHFNVLEALSTGQYNKVTRKDTTTGIFACPKLLYASDGEEEDNLPNAQEENLAINTQEDHRQDEVEGPDQPAEPFQSLDQLIDPRFERQRADQIRTIMTLSAEGNPLLKDEDVDLPERLSNVEWIEYLVKKGPTIAAPKNQGQTSRILRKLGGEIEVLPPGNDVDVGDWRDKSRWVKYVSALVSEMMTVEERCSSEVRDAGVFVLSTFQYPALLELMALEVLSADLRN